MHQIKLSSVKRIATVCFMLYAAVAEAQSESRFSVKTSAEIVSSYIWRGIPCYSYNNGQAVLAPNIQPSLGFVQGNFEAGAWGSSDFTGSYKELDLYASYTFKTVTATFTDYYWDADWLSHPYFAYKNKSTSHLLEGSIVYKSKKNPFSITLATIFAGDDKKATDVNKNNYSTYLELGYTFTGNAYNFDTFLGMTPADGLYGDGYGNVTGFGIVNMGVTATRKLQFSDHFEATLRTSLIFNPQQDKAYLVLGIAL